MIILEKCKIIILDKCTAYWFSSIFLIDVATVIWNKEMYIKFFQVYPISDPFSLYDDQMTCLKSCLSIFQVFRHYFRCRCRWFKTFFYFRSNNSLMLKWKCDWMTLWNLQLIGWIYKSGSHFKNIFCKVNNILMI